MNRVVADGRSELPEQESVIPELVPHRPGLGRRARDAVVHFNFEALGLLLGIVVLLVVFTVKSPYFLTVSNFKSLGLAVSLTGILAAAETIVLVSGSLDLSFMAVLALTGIASQKAYESTGSLGVAVVTALAVGAGCGLFNAAAVVGAGVNPLIATIGSQFAFRGVCFIWLGSSSLPFLGSTNFNFIGNGVVASVPFPVIMMVVSFATLWLTLHYTRFGSRAYAVGGNAVAARLAGVSISRLRTMVFVLSGVAAGIGGLLETSLVGSAYADAQTGGELTVIAAVIVGGTALTGGRGGMLGTAAGVLFLGMLANGLDLLGVNPYWEVTVSGLVLIGAVAIDESRKRAEER